MKIATTINPVHPLIRNRWSARAFADKPIERQTLDTLFEAASWAPSSMNEQPWRYYFAMKGEPAFDQMASCLLNGNEPWAKNAAVLILNTCTLRFKRNDKPNRHAMHDTGAANALLLLQAASMNIYGHQMGGYDPQKTIETFQVPPHTEVVCFMALGYIDHPDTLEEPYRTREITPRSRMQLAEFAALVYELIK
jgi:nitroreductase